MFNRCWRWQAMLSRRADSALSLKQWGALQNHLARCSRCRTYAQADDVLHDVLGAYTPPLSPDVARTFDDNVVAAFATSSALPCDNVWMRNRLKLSTHWRAIPLRFLGQIGGGAVFAVCLTSFFLVPALHSGATHGTHSARLSSGLVQDNNERSILPVPMETLLNTPSPRAAMLWTTPGERRSQRRSSPAAPVSNLLPAGSKPAPVNPEMPPRPTPTKVAPEKHSALLSNEAIG